MLSASGLLLWATLLWWVALQPAIRTLKLAPAQKAKLDIQWAEMRNLAQPGARGCTAAQHTEAGTRAGRRCLAVGETDRLQPKALLVIQGNRATVTFDSTHATKLGPWLDAVRAGARAHPIEAALSRNGAGFGGTVVLALGSKP